MQDMFIIVDTSFLLKYFELFCQSIQSLVSTQKDTYKVVIPFVVLRELDGLHVIDINLTPQLKHRIEEGRQRSSS